MEHKICAVCKQPIDENLVVESEHGPVHPGPCLNYVKDIPLAEDSNEQLNEVQLLC